MGRTMSFDFRGWMMMESIFLSEYSPDINNMAKILKTKFEKLNYGNDEQMIGIVNLSWWNYERKSS